MKERNNLSIADELNLPKSLTDALKKIGQSFSTNFGAEISAAYQQSAQFKFGQEAKKAGEIFISEYDKGYKKTIADYEDYFRVNGIIFPKSMSDVLEWAGTVYPDEPISFLVEIVNNPKYYKMYHGYKERLLNNPDWNSQKEYEYSKKEFAEPQPETLAEPQQSETEKIIHHLFKQGTKEGWQEIFRSEKDYLQYVTILTNYFEHNGFNKNGTTIQLKRTTKTKTAAILKSVHSELGNKTLKSDAEFFLIARMLEPFKDETDHNIYKALTRN